MHDLISRQAAIDALRTCYDTETISMDNGDEYINYGDAVGEIEHLPSAQPERMTNRQWVDFLSAQFDISRTSAKEMLHVMMRWKKEDNFKKMFNGGKT